MRANPWVRLLLAGALTLTSYSLRAALPLTGDYDEEATPEEPAAPAASPSVQRLLDEITSLLEAGNYEATWESARTALEAARTSNDTVGEALAHQSRAQALQKLGRREEALSAWLSAASAWERAGDGPGHADALVSAGLLVASKGPDAAAPYLDRALEICRAEKRRPYAASDVLCLAGLHMYGIVPLTIGRKFFDEALASQERLVPDSIIVAETLNCMSDTVTDLEGPKAAQALLLRALSIEERHNAQPMRIGRTLRRLGAVMRKAGELDQAAQYMRRSIAILEKIEPVTRNLVLALDELGQIERQLGDLDKANVDHRRALALAEKWSPRARIVAVVANNVAIVAADLGDLEAARAYFSRALEVDRTFRPGSLDIAEELRNLGGVAAEQRDWRAARDYYREALAIQERISPESEEVAATLMDLGVMEVDLGDLREARDYYERSLKLWKVTLGSGYLSLLGNLGYLEEVEGNLPAAFERYRQQLAIAEKRAPDSMDAAVAHGSLGRVLLTQGRLAEAEPHLARALAVIEKASPRHSRMSDILADMGTLLRRKGDLAGASDHVRRAIDLARAGYGVSHPWVAAYLIELTSILAESGDRAGAFQAGLEAAGIAGSHLRVTARTLPETEALGYAAKTLSARDSVLSLVSACAPVCREALQPSWDVVVRSRAAVLDEMAARHHLEKGSSDPEIRRLDEELVSARTRLARVLVRGPGQTPPAQYVKIVDGARKEKEDLEEQLASRSVSFLHERAQSRVGFADIKALVPPGGALVSFLRYSREQFRAAGHTTSPIPPATASYIAFVLPPRPGSPVAVPLGAAEPIDELVAKTRSLIAQEALDPGRSPVVSEAAYRNAATALRAAIWDPIRVHLRGASEIFVVPDGSLSLIDIATLPDGDGGYLVEHGLLVHYLSAERDLAALASDQSGEGLLALGDPDFDAAWPFLARAGVSGTWMTAQAAVPAASGPYRGGRAGCGDFASLRFDRLPASAREIEQVAEAWEHAERSAKSTAGRIAKLSGAEATENALYAMAPGRRFLHLATHGFFLGRQCGSIAESSSLDGPGPLHKKLIGQNPLLLSGLALAGANHRDSAGPEEQDGILTAEELASLDLHGVEWAALSGCETGVGEVAAGEGMLGLRRALQVAGVRTVITSLWQVDDESAERWMRALYEGRLVRRLDTARAIREADLKLLNERRRQGQSTHPFYWAGFVAAGDWR